MVERVVGSTSSASSVHEAANDNTNPYKNMVMDAMRMNQGNVSQCVVNQFWTPRAGDGVYLF